MLSLFLVNSSPLYKSSKYLYALDIDISNSRAISVALTGVGELTI